MSETTLHVWRRGVHGSLADALADVAAAIPDAIGFVFTPHRAIFVALRDGALHTAPDQTMSLPDAFEARVFNKTSELRWWHPPDAPNGIGESVLVTEHDQPPARTWTAASPPRPVHTMCNQYLLWGQAGAETSPAGWSMLLEARIGALLVPHAVPSDARVVLKTVEYVGVVDDYGNRDVIDERLMELEILS